MSDASVQELRSAVQASLDRGFALLVCEPRDKKPFAKYSPNAVNSSTRDPLKLFAAFDDGFEANYGVGCGPSNLTVVDCDHGLTNHEEFLAWKKAHNLPDTFTVLSGGDGYRPHMYYSGAVPTCKFQIGDVSGDLKGMGGYVVGPGSIHPSGKKYEIIDDASVAPLPDGLLDFAKTTAKTSDFKPKSDGGELIAAGNRWYHLRSAAGKLRNLGLDEDTIYASLKNFALNNCEDGANYPDEHIRKLAQAAVTVFDAAEPAPIVFFGEQKKIDVNITELPDDAIEGDWLGEMTHLLSDGTFIPPAFTRAQIKTILGASLDGLVGFPNQSDLHMKHWTMLISKNPESGKGKSWTRTGEMALLNYLIKTGVKQPKSGWFSSGEHMIKKLCDEEYEGKNTITYFDELKTLFEKGSGTNSTLFSKLIELYDRSDGSAGSLTHEGGSFNHISISFTGGFTCSSFDAAVTGKGAGGDGFLSRCVLAYTGDVAHIGDWPDLDTTSINAVAGKMLKRYGQIFEESSKQKQLAFEKKNAAEAAGLPYDEPPVWRFIPKETEAAKALRVTFQKRLAEKRTELAQDELGHMVARLEAHFKRDLLLRAIFSDAAELDDITITEDMVRRSIAWAEYELYLREELWPVDRGDKVERMEQCMRRALKKHPSLTKTQLKDACHVHRAGSGGAGVFLMAWKGMVNAEEFVVVGKTHKGTEKYGLAA